MLSIHNTTNYDRKIFYLSFSFIERFQIVKYSIIDVECKKVTTRIRWHYIFALIDISLLERTYHIYPITLLLFYIVCRWMHHCMKSLRGSMRFVDLEYKNFFQKIFIAKLQTFTAYVKYNPSFPYILAFYAFDFFFVIRANEILWWYYIDICSLKFTYLHKWYKVFCNGRSLISYQKFQRH